MQKPTRKQTREPSWLDQHEQQTLIRTVEGRGNVRDRALITLLLHTGLRVGELCALIWRDVQIAESHGTMRVQGTQDPRRGGRITLPRTLPLNTPARQALCALGYGQHGGTSAQIFMGQRGPMTPRGVEIVLEKYAKMAGLKGITPDTLRHTFCKNLVDVGADVTSVAALAGHPTLDTARLYFTWPPQGLDQLVELLGHEA